jgi:hypothetical protein
MTFAPTTHLLAAKTTAVSSDTLYPVRRQDEVGKIQLKIVGTSATIKIKGRSEPAAPWATLLTLTEADVADNDTVYALIELVPEMQAEIVNITAATVDLWLTE